MSQYAERKQRKIILQRQAAMAMETGDVEQVLKHERAGRYKENSEYYYGIAAEHGHIAIVDPYLNNRSNKGGRTFLLMSKAAYGEQLEMMDYLISQGASVKALNDGLSDAAMYGKNKSVEFLISKGADVAFNANEPLLMAATDGHAETVKLLVKHGADIYAKDDRALQLAIVHNHSELTRTLIVDLNMTIKPETQKWLEENNHTYATQLITKRDLFHKLNQSSERRPPSTQTKEKKMKI